MGKDDDNQFDLRLIAYRSRQGIITKESYDAHLKTIPDSAANVEYIDAAFEPKVEEVTERSDSYGSLAFTPADGATD